MRIIGIRVRNLKTTTEEERPTQVAILNENGEFATFDLEDEQAEVDFIRGKHPIRFREPTAEDNLTLVEENHITWKEVDEAAFLMGPTNLVRRMDKPARGSKPAKVNYFKAVKIADLYVGLEPNDVVAMSLGGQGNLLARDMNEYASKINVQIQRTPPFVLKDEREARKMEKDDDAKLLALIFRDSPERFYLFREADALEIGIALAYEERQTAQRERIRHGNRLKAIARHTLLKSLRSDKPIDSMEQAFETAKKEDEQWARFEREEQAAEERFTDLLESHPLWQKISDIKGLGVVTVAGLIAAIGDIRRFIVEPETLFPNYRAARSELDALLKEAEYVTTKELMLAEGVEIPSGAFERLTAARTYQRENGMSAEADKMTEAINLFVEVGKMESKARNKGCNRFLVYCGVGLKDGKFQRRAKGQRANWNPTARQRFYLLGDIFNKLPDSEWGQKLRSVKAELRVKHPEEVLVEVQSDYDPREDWAFVADNRDLLQLPAEWNAPDIETFRAALKDLQKRYRKELDAVASPGIVGHLTLALKRLDNHAKPKMRKLYTNGHIHRMARWRTLTIFARMIYNIWTKIERDRKNDGTNGVSPVTPANNPTTAEESAA